MTTAVVPAQGTVHRRRAWRPTHGYVAVLAVPAIFLGIFFVWPLIRVVLRSFVEPRLGLGNYERVLFTGPFVRVLVNTFEIALSVTLICLVVAYPLAYVIARARGLG